MSVFLTEKNANTFLRNYLKRQFNNFKQIEKGICIEDVSSLAKFFKGKKLSKKQFARMVRDHRKQTDKLMRNEIKISDLLTEDMYARVFATFEYKFDDSIPRSKRSFDDMEFADGFIIRLVTFNRLAIDKENIHITTLHIHPSYHCVMRYIQRNNRLDIEQCIVEISKDVLVMSHVLTEQGLNVYDECVIRGEYGCYILKQFINDDGIKSYKVLTYYKDCREERIYLDCREFGVDYDSDI